MARVDAQLGNVTRAQLRAAGVDEATIDHWLRRGRLCLHHRGVYGLTQAAVPMYGAEMAAILATQPGAVLSHASAAHVWGIRRVRPRVVEVTVIGRHIRGRDRIRVHRTAALAAIDYRSWHGIRLTSPARTILDLAAVLAERELELALHEAIALRILSIREMRAALERYPGRRGSAKLLKLLERPTSTVTNSGGEEALYQLIRRSGLPLPEVNASIGRWTADFYWPAEQLVVEVDGSDFHSTRPRLERDHRKDLAFRKLGIDVVRFVGRQVAREPELVLVTVAQELAARGPRRVRDLARSPRRAGS